MHGILVALGTASVGVAISLTSAALPARAVARRIQVTSPTTIGWQRPHSSGHALARTSGPMPATSPIVNNKRGVNFTADTPRLLPVQEENRPIPGRNFILNVMQGSG